MLWYGVATIRRLLKIIGLGCKRALQKRLYSAKETCNFMEPTIRSHPVTLDSSVMCVENFNFLMYVDSKRSGREQSSWARVIFGREGVECVGRVKYVLVILDARVMCEG